MSLRLFLLCLSALLLSGRAPESPLRPSKDHALFFAIDDYPAGSGWQDLPTPISDAEAIATVLHDYYGFDTTIHRNPTRAKIEVELRRWQRKSYGPEEQLFLFFTGHGRKDYLYDEGFFVPANGANTDNHLPLLQLSRAIDRIPCDHILLGIDACYSGNILKGDDEPEPQLQRYGESEEDRTRRIIRETLEFKTRYVLTSGGDERTPAGERYTPLTNRLVYL